MCVVTERYALSLLPRLCYISYDGVYSMIQYVQCVRMLKGCDDRTTPGSGLAVDELDVSFLNVCRRSSSCTYRVVYLKSDLS